MVVFVVSVNAVVAFAFFVVAAAAKHCMHCLFCFAVVLLPVLKRPLLSTFVGPWAWLFSLAGPGGWWLEGRQDCSGLLVIGVCCFRCTDAVIVGFVHAGVVGDVVTAVANVVVVDCKFALAAVARVVVVVCIFALTADARDIVVDCIFILACFVVII